MSDDNKPIVAHGEQEDVMDGDDVLETGMDELDRFIVYALGGLGPPLMKQVITEVDRETDAETCGHSSTDTSCGGPREPVPPAPDFDELKERHRACRNKRQVNWNYPYLKGKKIGSGGQGVVYQIQSEDKFGNRATRALKIFSPKPYGSAQAYYEDMERMASLAEVVRQDGHNNVLKVEHFGPCDDSTPEIFAICMHLILGFDLRRLLGHEVMKSLERYVPSVDRDHWAYLNRVVFAPRGTEQMALQPGVAVNIIDQCLQGVSALHDRGMYHADLKLSNIMLNNHGSVKLIDIGSAFQKNLPPRQPTCTPRYAPPEVLEKEEWTPQSDIASLGYVLIELLTGQPELMGPHGKSIAVHDLDKETRTKLAKGKRHLFEHLDELIPERVRRSPILMELCRTCIQPDPADRFETAEQAIVLTDRFNNELVFADLTVPWVRVFKQWLTYAIQAMSDAGVHN